MHGPGNNPKRCPVRLLIVDRHLLFAEGLRRLLEDCEEVELAAIATKECEVPRQANSPDPDVILLDPWLNGKGPFAVVQKLREAAPQARLLFLEDEINEVHVRMALKLRARGFLTKSCPFLEIREAIQSVVRGSHAFGTNVKQYVINTPRGLRFNRAAISSPLSTLTGRELEITRLLARGLTIRETARHLKLAVSTVDNHKSRIMKKLHVHKAVELATMAIREGLIS